MKKKTTPILETGYDLDETQQQRLITVLNELEDEVEKQNSWQHIFVRGTFYGLGTVIGATVLLALLGSVLAMVVDAFGIANVPVLGDLIRDLIINEIGKH
jgi:hypothetical protein